jgi:hypothetical protein
MNPFIKRPGRPKGSKNKPKRGRPKKEKQNKQRGRPAKSNFELSTAANLQNNKQEENIFKQELSDEKFLEPGYVQLQKESEIFSEPIDPSYYYRGSKNIPIAGAPYKYTLTMLEQLEKCKQDVVHFAENFFYIVNIDNGKQKIKLYEAQKNMLLNMVNNRFTVNLASRQSGKSTLLTIFVLWMTCFNDDHRAAIVANKESTAINIFKRVRMAYEQLPNYIKPGVKDYGKTGVTFANDSSIVVSTTTATSIRGDSLNTLAIDEVAFIESHILEEFWSSVIPATSSGKTSKILLVSTPNGVGNKFYEIFSGAESGTLPDWHASRIDWWDKPGRDEVWKSNQIQLLGSEERFQQEFGNTFLDSYSTAVGSNIIEFFKKTKKDPIWISEDGTYKVFQKPDIKKLYVIGVDVGEGIGRASSVAQVLDITDLKNIEQVAIYASPDIEPFHFANKLKLLIESWGLPPILIERNNCGAQVIDALYYTHQYEKIVGYSKVSEQDRYNKTRSLGILSHQNIKFDGIQNMRYWVNHLQCVKINDASTISEFETFVRFPHGVFKKKSDSFFDDRVMSLVWALFILEPSLCEQYFQIEHFDAQNKPLSIVSNNYWEVYPEYYGIKDLNNNNKQVEEFELTEKQPTSNYYTSVFNEDEILNKFDLDVDDLTDLGFKFL